jgi:hypothetical protein
MANETIATLQSWDRILRRAQQIDPHKWARRRNPLPRRDGLKASLHPCLYRIKPGRVLDFTIHPDRYLQLDPSNVPSPLFEKYGTDSGWTFGLTLTDPSLVFQLRIPKKTMDCPEAARVDVNMASEDFATSDGTVGSVDLRPITRVQGAMARKGHPVQRHLRKDLRLQRKVLRRMKRRQRHRVEPIVHVAANELLSKIGERNVGFEDHTSTQEELRTGT